MTNYLQSLGVIEIVPVIHKDRILSIHPNFSDNNSIEHIIRDFELFLKSFEPKVKLPERAASFQNRKRSTSYNSNHPTVASGHGKRQGTEKDKLRQPVGKSVLGASSTIIPLLDDERFQSNCTLVTGTPRCNDNLEIDWASPRESEHLFQLSKILPLFNGSLSVREVVASAPIYAKDFMIEIILFLLRYTILPLMLLSFTWYVGDMLFTPLRETCFLSQQSYSLVSYLYLFESIR